MLKRFFIGLLMSFLAGGGVGAQSVTVVKFNKLKQLLDRPNDTLYVVNFWATWCAPCVKELPYFENTNKAYASKRVKILLISMDEKEELQKKVIPFIRTRNIQSKVLLLDEPDANTWIDKVAPEWSGALPMTLIINEKQKIRRFIGKPVKQDELTAIINQYIL